MQDDIKLDLIGDPLSNAKQGTTDNKKVYVQAEWVDEAELGGGLVDSSSLDGVNFGHLETMQLLGQLQAMQFSATVAEKAQVEIYLKLKESGKYKGLPYKDSDGNVRLSHNLDEICRVFFGKSQRRLRELVANEKLLGPELHEQAEKIGFQQRDYNAMKKLPEEEKQVVAEAIKDGDLDKALGLIGQMALKHEQEKEALLADIELRKKEALATENRLQKVIDQKEKHYNNVERERKLTQLELDAMTNKQPSHNPFNLDTNTIKIREEACVFEQGFRLHAQQMQLLIDKTFKESATSVDDVTVRTNAIAIGISSMLAEIEALTSAFKSAFPGHALPASIGVMDKLSPEEVENIQLCNEMLAKQLESKKQNIRR